MKPNVMCLLTPDAVSLLDLIHAKSIGYTKVGELADVNGIKGNGHASDENHRRRAVRSDAGKARVKINGVTLRSYRKGAPSMSKNAVLTIGDKPRTRSNSKIRDEAKAVVDGMTMNTSIGAPTINRAKAIEIISKRHPQKRGSFHSGVVSRLYRYGHLREVLA